MSKRLITGLLVASLALLSFGCDEDNNNSSRPQKPSTGDECSSDTWTDACKNASTLLKCEGGKVVSQECEEGYKCQKGECIQKPPPTVTCNSSDSKPTCSSDGHYVLVCEGGIQQSTECPYGCSNGACVTACTFEGKQCNYANTAVTECQGGKIVEVEQCPCNMGKCKETCSDKNKSTCKGDTSVYCGPDGFASETKCPTGCDAASGACNERCSEGCSKDGKKLIACKVDGTEDTAATETCQYGCKNKKCLTEEEASGSGGGGTGQDNPPSGQTVTVSCKEDGERCSLKGEAIICNDSGNQQVVPCDYGCDHGKCVEAASAPACTSNDDHCNTFGQVLYRCVDGKQAQTVCEFGCSNGKCNDADHAIKCAEGSAECANGGQMIMECKNNELVFNACPNGCEEGKCIEKAEEKEPCQNDSCFFGKPAKVRRCVGGFFEDEVCQNSQKCVFNAYGKGQIECVPNDYCSEDGECIHLGKTSCNLETYLCE